MQQIRVGVGILRRVERSLGHRDVAGRGHEPAEFGHGHRVVVHPEPVDFHLAHRALLGVEVR